MDGDHIGWTESFLSERTVEIIIEDNAMDRHPVEAWVPQGSPVSPILFAINNSRLIILVEEYVLKAKWLSFGNDLGWVATGSNVNQVVRSLERCAARNIEWASTLRLQFDTPKMEVTPCTCRQGNGKHIRPKLTTTIIVGNRFILIDTQAPHLLVIWMEEHLIFEEQHN